MMMRNVLLKLGASTDKKINPKIVGLSKSLENLAGIQDDVTTLTKMFGRQNVIAAQTLIKQRGTVDELTEALTGTNIAYEQQATNTDNLISDYKKLGSSWEKLVLNLNQGSGAISTSLRGATQWATSLLDKIDELNKTDKEREERYATKELDAFKATLSSVTSEEEFQNKLLEERKKTAFFIEQASKRYQAFGGKDAVEQAKKLNSVGWGITRNLGEAVGLVDTQKNLEIEANAERLKGLQIYAKELGDLGRKGFTQIEPPKMVEAVEGIGQVEEQVTKITSAAPKVFNINIESLIEELSINSQTVTEGVSELQNVVTEALTRAVADVQARA
jgi:hypothetical protein